MRIPRNISASILIKKLKSFGYEVTRQTGSHIRLTTQENGQHHITVPNHDPIRIGTFASIVTKVGVHFGKTKDEMVKELFS